MCDWSIDLLFLMARQFSEAYFMLRGKGIVFILFSFLHFFVLFTRIFSFTQFNRMYVCLYICV